MEQNGTNKVANSCNVSYICNSCDYITSRKSSYDKHLYTDKHNRKLLSLKTHICYICNKKYTTASGLWKHKQKCNIQIEEEKVEVEEPVGFTTQMFYELLKQNNEFKELIIEQNNELSKQIIGQNTEFKEHMIELASKQTINNNTTNNNTTNNSFNLHFFLNDTCKGAVNMSDFVSQLQVGIHDLEETGRLGYAEGVSRIFINGLKQLEVNKRPIHCSDLKRETVYIKDENQWKKGDENNTELTSAIRDVAHKNIMQLYCWADAHPESTIINSKQNDQYMKLMGKSMPGGNHEEADRSHKKVSKNIMKNTTIGK